MPNVLKRIIKNSFNFAGCEIRRKEDMDPKKFIWLKNKNIKTIVDTGANVGQFAMFIHNILPDARIYSFEPLRDCYERLIENMRYVSNFKAFNFALGCENCETVICRNDCSGSSSLLHMDELHKELYPTITRETLEKINLRHLDEFIKELRLKDNILIKMDVEGYEDRVIKGGSEVIKKAAIFIVEIRLQNLYVGQASFAAIFDMLREKRFKYFGSLNQVFSHIDGSVLQVDAVFIK